MERKYTAPLHSGIYKIEILKVSKNEYGVSMIINAKAFTPLSINSDGKKGILYFSDSEQSKRQLKDIVTIAGVAKISELQGNIIIGNLVNSYIKSKKDGGIKHYLNIHRIWNNDSYLSVRESENGNEVPFGLIYALQEPSTYMDNIKNGISDKEISNFWKGIYESLRNSKNSGNDKQSTRNPKANEIPDDELPF